MSVSLLWFGYSENKRHHHSGFSLADATPTQTDRQHTFYIGVHTHTERRGATQRRGDGWRPDFSATSKDNKEFFLPFAVCQ